MVKVWYINVFADYDSDTDKIIFSLYAKIDDKMYNVEVRLDPTFSEDELREMFYYDPVDAIDELIFHVRSSYWYFGDMDKLEELRAIFKANEKEIRDFMIDKKINTIQREIDRLKAELVRWLKLKMGV